MKTPVALTLFNNPEAVAAVFQRIREARPPKLFLIADGGRTPEEQDLINQSIAHAEVVDWPCEVFRNYADHNMGTRARVSSGISWVFEHVERCIILEHDCLADSTFFRYCEELLEHYQDDERVMNISGTNFHQRDPQFSCGDSYYFSHIPLIWGFATWRRAWKRYDVEMASWPAIQRTEKLRTALRDPAALERWVSIFDRNHRRIISSWDAQWVFACLEHNGLSITPSVNLVSNIGFGPRALTSKDPRHMFASLPTVAMRFPLVHPSIIAPDERADAYIQRHLFDVRRTLRSKIKWTLKEHAPWLYALLGGR